MYFNSTFLNEVTKCFTKYIGTKTSQNKKRQNKE